MNWLHHFVSQLAGLKLKCSSPNFKILCSTGAFWWESWMGTAEKSHTRTKELFSACWFSVSLKLISGIVSNEYLGKRNYFYYAKLYIRIVMTRSSYVCWNNCFFRSYYVRQVDWRKLQARSPTVKSYFLLYWSVMTVSYFS